MPGGDDSSDVAVIAPVVDDYSYAPYKPRYSEEESSDAAYEKDVRHRRCMERKRRLMTILSFIVFIGVSGFIARLYLFFAGIRGRLSGNIQIIHDHDLSNQTTSSLWNVWKKKAKSNPGFGRASADSNGFFDAISDEVWMGMKDETKSIIDEQDGIMMRTSYLLTEGGANIDSHVWWIDNWKINFTCQSKVSIGGKWICDPKRILTIADERKEPAGKKGRKKGNNQQMGCLIYVSGGMEMNFGHQFLDYSLARMFELHDGQVAGTGSLPCEVHIFTPNLQELPEPRDGIFLHNWGFRPSSKESMGLAGEGAFKTLEETIEELQHSGRVSVLALDCETCEWDIYPDIVSLEEPIQQVLMQMHGTPYTANELFLAMQEAGYVIFHRAKELSGGGEVFDYSWIKLSPTFFNWRI